jgi:hypothetical protein
MWGGVLGILWSIPRASESPLSGYPPGFPDPRSQLSQRHLIVRYGGSIPSRSAVGPGTLPTI